MVDPPHLTFYLPSPHRIRQETTGHNLIVTTTTHAPQTRKVTALHTTQPAARAADHPEDSTIPEATGQTPRDTKTETGDRADRVISLVSPRSLRTSRDRLQGSSEYLKQVLQYIVRSGLYREEIRIIVRITTDMLFITRRLKADR